MVWQFYWPNWWKLWPVYHKTLDTIDDDGHWIYSNVFAFGPYQSHWFSS